MGYRLDRFDKAAGPLLAADEKIVGGTWARTPGGFAQERAFGLVGGVASQFGSGAAGSVRLPKAFEVAATGRRLLFFERSAMTGRPHEFVADVDLADIEAAEQTSDAKRIYSIAVRLRDGGTMEFEVAKAGAAKLAEQFVATVNGLLGQRRQELR